MKEFNVFIIEDNIVAATAIEQTVLSVNAEINIYKYTNIEKALTNIGVFPDIVLLDHYLDYAKGVDSIPAIMNTFPHTKIAVVSAQEDIDVFSNAYKYGATTYFKKNKGSLSKIFKFVESCIKSKGKSNSDFLKQLGDLFSSISLKDSCIEITIIEDDEIFSFAVEYAIREREPKINWNPFMDLEHFFNSSIKQNPDYIILDYKLGKKNVTEEDVKSIKSEFPKAKLILLSANSDITIAENLKEFGVDYYLNKSKKNMKELQLIISDK